VSAKPTGLAAFTKGKAPSPAPAGATADAPAAKSGRRRAQGETVALTVRIPRAEWMRLHQLATAEGVSLQTLALDGFSEVFAKHGLPPIAS
jgi:hypothetical protein